MVPLNEDVILVIASFLDNRELLCLALVCRLLRGHSALTFSPVMLYRIQGI
jgi:hypothetical protein